MSFKPFCILAGALATAAACAQPYPAKPIHVIVGTAVSTPVDILSRVVAERLGAVLGTSVVVENRPGATGILGAEEVLKQPADGYTLMTLFMPMSVAPALYENLRFNLVTDFEPVGQTAWSYNVLVAYPGLKLHSVKELIALLKKEPGKLNFSSGGPGTPAHLAGELFLMQTGTRALHVPYVQFPQAISDLLSGTNQYMFAATPPVIGHIAAGRLTALAVTGPSRIPALSGVPTMEGAGVSDFVVRDWQGFVARRGTSADIVKKLNAALAQAMRSPQLVESFGKLGADPVTGTPEAFKSLIASEVERWGKVARAAHIKAQ